MRKLDCRLAAVAEQVTSTTHADVGSDHATLLVHLLKHGRIERGIAIENKRQPYQNSKLALAHLPAETRFGNGLEALRQGEADSLSVSGMGAEKMVRILEAFPNRVPEKVVLQPNRQPEQIRKWALRNEFHLVDEQVAWGHWPYTILQFAKAEGIADPAYRGVSRDAALLLGPLIIKRRDPRFLARLQQERDYFTGFNEPGRAVRQRLSAIETVLSVQL